MTRVVLVSGGRAGFRQEIAVGPHRLHADEPREEGGSDIGPSPYELLLGSLGACTSMTLRMYADRKQWPLQEVQVRLTFSQIHAEDCLDCETKQGMVNHIQREISLVGDLSEEQRNRLLEIADHCPVHRLLTSELKIDTRLAEPAT
ncbi:MAG: OsmC-like protein [Chthonomonadaceae bacterium]|nr:OsmC-like protein [Chthonomonadaceae bacterium]